jgi:hypothetical protein
MGTHEVLFGDVGVEACGGLVVAMLELDRTQSAGEVRVPHVLEEVCGVVQVFVAELTQGMHCSLVSILAARDFEVLTQLLVRVQGVLGYEQGPVLDTQLAKELIMFCLQMLEYLIDISIPMWFISTT